MTLREVIQAIQTVEGESVDTPTDSLLDMPVRFNTRDRRGLHLLSVYQNGNVVEIDIGEYGE